MTRMMVSATLSLMLLASLAAVAADDSEMADEERVVLKVGDRAPDVTLPKPDRPAGSAETVKLSEYQGKKNVLLAFYPKAFTPGCTKQLCGYRDNFKRFESAETMVFAISKDVQQESDRFRAQHQLPFAVVGDTNQDIINAYGVPIKQFKDQEFSSRSVVLIDRQGIIRYIDLEYDIDKDRFILFHWLTKLAKDERPQ